jgi:tRNA threonylcarbamoyl adenosine modification protein YeaZ
MKLLALDAALGGFSAAVDDGARLHVASSGRQDALEHGLGRIEELLAEAGLRLRDLDRIAVGTGPGSFTGVRIAVAYAKSLAYGSGVPLTGISSYDALEPDGAPLPVLTVVRGRRGVICARLRGPDGTASAGGGDGTEIACGPTAEVLDGLLARPPGTVHVAGNTEDVLSEIAERGWVVRALPPRADVPAVAIAQLARTRDPSPSPHALAPDYGESPAVTRPKTRP